ncbi:MAG: adenylate kinase [Crenarchaeota archaeon]|nr:MAG: adenylate kinase [Thermoproteota archaeon]RDJ33655.1 MAG: adenylate kinase [Thermoproteota archaeon]RDJ37233.1 MAG: adenylate kinase [Thermoproteota archaeon]RDJ39187.1 MAG: adenylate kinase [Thermoproteota archaeon]
MVESKKVVMVGIPGVGKTTLVSKIVEILNGKNKSVKVVSFGTVMLEEAKKNGCKDRDDLRKLTTEEQQKLQRIAGEKIAAMHEDLVIIDTHAFIVTPAGFYPGLPDYVMKIIKPSNFITVSARPEEIYNRRMKDDTRNRDIISIDAIKKELSVQESMVSACSVLSGSPMMTVLNREGKIEEAAETVINAIGL